MILFFLANSLTFCSVSGAPLKASLLWIKETSAPIFDNSIVQSSALSPPPKIAKLFGIHRKLSRHEKQQISTNCKITLQKRQALLEKLFYKIKKNPKTQFLIDSKINNEIKIKYKHFYKELDQIIAS